MNLLALVAGKTWVPPLVLGVALIGAGSVAAATGAVSDVTGSAPTATATTQPSATAAATAGAATSDQTGATAANGGGGNNVVQAINHADNHVQIRTGITLTRVPGSTVRSSNIATSYSSCSNCQTLSVALQIVLISKTARDVQPANVATAVNYQCDHCTTVARALQYVLSVDDPTQVPPEVNQLMAQMHHTLAQIQSDGSIADAEQQVNAVIAQYQSLTAYLHDRRDATTAGTSPNATPLASPTSGPSPTPTPSGTAGETPTAGPEQTGTPPPSASETPTPSATAGTTPTPPA